MTGDEETDPNQHIDDQGLPKISGMGSSEGPQHDDDPAADIGQEIGDFEILEEVGRGGMGVVYRAYEKRLKRVVALKVLHARIAENPSAAKRFRREAVLVASLSHPNIVPVFNIEDSETPRYFAMEFVQGQSLEAKVEADGHLSPAEVMRIAVQACDALRYAHEHNIIHRDIKPGNILLQNHTERVRITDFGIAQEVTGTAGTAAAAAGASAGTPAFMSPEQNLGGPLDSQTDIFSLGMALYYLLTGQVAYRARTREELAGAFREHTPLPPSQLNREVPAALDRIVMKMIEVDRRKRYANCSDVLADLRRLEEIQWRSGLPQPRSRRSSRWRAALLALLAIGAVVVVAAVATFWWRQWAGAKPQEDLVKTYYRRASSYEAKGDYDRAIADYGKAIELKPGFAAAYSGRGSTYRRKKEYERAIRDFGMALELDSTFATAYGGRGLVHLEKGNLDLAIADCNKAIELNPRWAIPYYGRGVAYEKKGQHDLATADFTRAVEIAPDLADVYAHRGAVYLDIRNWSCAIEDYTKAIELGPDDAAAYCNRGSAYSHQEAHDKAMLDFEKALALNPRLKQAYNNRAAIYFMRGDYEKAWACVKACEDLGGQCSPDLMRDLRRASGRPEVGQTLLPQESAKRPRTVSTGSSETGVAETKVIVAVEPHAPMMASDSSGSLLSAREWKFMPLFDFTRGRKIAWQSETSADFGGSQKVTIGNSSAFVARQSTKIKISKGDTVAFVLAHSELEPESYCRLMIGTDAAGMGGTQCYSNILTGPKEPRGLLYTATWEADRDYPPGTFVAWHGVARWVKRGPATFWFVSAGVTRLQTVSP
jgi:serine/threonine-protein kinase